MKKLTITFQARNKFTALTILKLLKVGFKKAVKVRNKKEKDIKGEFCYTAEFPPQHYGEITITITGKNEAVNKEEKILTDSLYKLLSEYKNDKKLNGTIYNLLKNKTISWTKDKIIKIYTLLGIIITWKNEKWELKE